MSSDPLSIDGLVCDLDGVVYRSSEVIPGAPEAIASLRSEGVRIVFATNNATHTVSSYVARLAAHGIDVEESDVLTSAVVTAEEMTGRGWTGRSVFLVGSDGIREALQAAQMDIVAGEDARRADIVVISGDPNFDYDAMRTALYALRNGADLIATNDDPTFPVSDGLWPGTGAILASIERASGRTAEVMGKPNRPMMAAARRRLSGCRHIAVVGDQPATDLAGGRSLGWTTVLVLSGVTGEDIAATLDPTPDLVASDLAEVAALVSSGR